MTNAKIMRKMIIRITAAMSTTKKSMLIVNYIFVSIYFVYGSEFELDMTACAKAIMPNRKQIIAIYIAKVDSL